MKIVVLLFASLAEIVGEKRLDLDLDPGSTLAAVRAQLGERFPGVAVVPFVFARNQEYATDDVALVDGDEVACVPAISGGQPGDAHRVPRVVFYFSHEPLDARGLEDAVRRDADGAIVTFHGVTRDHHDGKSVASLSYEAYEEMACATATRILEELAGRHEVGRIHVAHRLGAVPIGETSIVVVVAAPHRGPAFDVAREAMDRIKKEVPIFKKEFFADEAGARWVGELPDVD